jgi:hypothetical protein
VDATAPIVSRIPDGWAPARWLARPGTTAVAIAVLFILQAFIRFGSHISHDVAWYLYAAGRVLDGAVLYVDVVEVNPPLGIWLALPFAALHGLTGISAIALFEAGVFFLTAVSLALVARFLSAASAVSAGARHLFLVAVAALMLFLPAFDFGQREHLLILLVTPWVLLRWNRLMGKPVSPGLAVVVGLMAAMGLWQKPHCLLAAAAIEAAILWRTRSLRATLAPENLAAVVFSVAYVAAVLLITPQFFDRILGLATAAYVPFFRLGLGVVAPRAAILLVLAAAALAGRRFVTPDLKALHGVLLAGGSALLFAFVIQAGFRYQMLPAFFMLALAAVIGLVPFCTGEAAAVGMRERLTAVGCAAMVAALAIGASAIQLAPYRGAIFGRAIAAEASAARSIFIASTHVYHPFPMVEERGLTWASRFPHQWLAPYVATKLDATGGPTDAIGRYALTATVHDFIRFRPDVVFVDDGGDMAYFTGPPLDYIRFWQHDPRFAPFWRQYEERGVTDGFAVYVRRAPSAP